MVTSNRYLIHARTCAVLLLFLSLVNAARAQNDLDVIQGKNQWLAFTDAGNSLYHHFADQAYGYLEARKETIDNIETLDQWKVRQQQVRETLLEVNNGRTSVATYVIK